jgi:hypothetical protein
MIRGIKWRAVLIALFAYYVAPPLPLVVISSIPNFFGVEPGQRYSIWQTPFVLVLAWFYAIAPVGAAYFAAKLARQQPLLHGVLIGIVGSVLVVIWVHATNPVYEAVLALLVLSCGLFGGWLCRYRNAQQNVAL